MERTRRWVFPLAVAGALLGAGEARATDKPPVTWYPSAPGNYDSSRAPIDLIVIHKAEGSAYSAAATFANPNRKASAHYSVGPGIVYQMVHEKNTAWHCGNYRWNQRAIGIENGGYSARNDTTDAHYKLLAKLTANICERYKIPVDRKHIVAHAEVPDPTNPNKFGGLQHHWDPGPHFDWSYFMGLVRAHVNGTTPTVPPPQPATTLRGITIIANDLNVRASAWGTIIANIDSGRSYVATGKKDQSFVEIWFRGRRAWVHSLHVKYAAKTAARVDVQDLNVRTSGSMSASIVGLCHKGQHYVQTDTTADWRRIWYGVHQRWIFRDYSTAVPVKG